jgi:hypothetical protein
MTFEQMEGMMQFILEHQAASELKFERLQASSEALEAKLNTLAEITHSLLEVARFHSRRLDRLDGMTPC